MDLHLDQHLRGVTCVTINEIDSGDWGIGVPETKRVLAVALEMTRVSLGRALVIAAAAARGVGNSPRQ